MKQYNNTKFYIWTYQMYNNTLIQSECDFEQFTKEILLNNATNVTTKIYPDCIILEYRTKGGTLYGVQKFLIWNLS